MPSIAIVDANILYAAADIDDSMHSPALEVLGRRELLLILPALAVAEVTHLIGARLGAAAEAAFLEGLAPFDVRAPESEDWPRIADLVRKYADFPLGGTDASIVALAERLNTDTIITLDRRHFAAIKPKHCDSLRLLPE